MDRIIRCITSDGAFMACAIDSTDLVYTAQQLHGLTKTSCAALGRLLTGASMMGAMLKSADATLSLKINGDGALGSLVAVSDSRGNVRGYVDDPSVDFPLKSNGKIDVSRAVGTNGKMAVIRDFGNNSPYIGQVELVSGEIAEDIAQYYVSSEQIPTVCALGVLVDKTDGKAILSGGFLIQALPGVTDSELSKLEENISALEPVTTMLAKGMTVEQMCETALKGFEVEKLDEFAVHYACTCNKEKYAAALLTLGAKEILELPLDDEGNVETVCQFCGKRYYFSKSELEKIAEKAKLK